MIKGELLAPAGSYEGLQAVIRAGADAVYIGGNMFGARAYADNPDTEKLKKAIDFTHIHGKKIYLAVNTLLKNQELYGQLYDFMAPFYEQGADGVIVQDFGVLSFLKKEFPEIPIHASTQMTVTGPEGARLLQQAGVSRVVPARELSLEEIRMIHQETGMEIECFVHGALCYCYSGICLFSSMLGGRSGNRGRCAQPCRLPYEVHSQGKILNNRDSQYVLSPKDMCTIDILPEILEAGVYSLKIEGRMKRPEYAAGVTSIYRKYLDLLEKNPREYKVSETDRKILLDLYQRDGFNQGYYHQHNGRDMMAVVNYKEQKKGKKNPVSRNEKLFEELKRHYLDTKTQEKIYGNLILFAESPAILDLGFRDTHVHIQGETAEAASKQPLSAERLEKQMRKTGDTPFVFDRLDVMTDEKSFLPMQSLNALRREGLKKLQEAYLSKFKRDLPERTPLETSRRPDDIGHQRLRTCRCQPPGQPVRTTPHGHRKQFPENDVGIRRMQCLCVVQERCPPPRDKHPPANRIPPCRPYRAHDKPGRLPRRESPSGGKLQRRGHAENPLPHIRQRLPEIPQNGFIVQIGLHRVGTVAGSRGKSGGKQALRRARRPRRHICGAKRVALCGQVLPTDHPVPGRLLPKPFGFHLHIAQHRGGRSGHPQPLPWRDIIFVARHTGTNRRAGAAGTFLPRDGKRHWGLDRSPIPGMFRSGTIYHKQGTQHLIKHTRTWKNWKNN